jgi:CRISPR/Cas system CSM-associated protein Csm2 small subunit
MQINNQNIDIDDLVSDKYMHKEIKKGIFLSEYQIEVLTRYQIDLDKISSVEELIMIMDEIIDEDPDSDDLEQISKEISEFNYYSNTNK